MLYEVVCIESLPSFYMFVAVLKLLRAQAACRLGEDLMAWLYSSHHFERHHNHISSRPQKQSDEKQPLHFLYRECLLDRFREYLINNRRVTSITPSSPPAAPGGCALISRSIAVRSRTVDVHSFVSGAQNKASFCSNTSPMSRRSARTTSTHTLLSHFPRQAAAPPRQARAAARQILRYSTPFPGV